MPNRLHSALPFHEVILARSVLSIRRFVCAAMVNPKCFFDITIGGKPAGRIVFEVSTLSFDYRAYDSCTATTHFFFDKLFFIVLVRVCATHTDR